VFVLSTAEALVSAGRSVVLSYRDVNKTTLTVYRKESHAKY